MVARSYQRRFVFAVAVKINREAGVIEKLFDRGGDKQ
jgi:hypothetical protein